MRYIKKKPRFNDETHEKAWFIRVTVNCAKSFLSNSWNSTEPLNDSLEYPRYEGENLDFAMKQLAPKTRIIMCLYYYEGYSAREIAEMLARMNNIHNRATEIVNTDLIYT